MTRTYIKNPSAVIGPKKIRKPDGILIEDNRIISFEEIDKSDIVIDASDCILSPGLINMHTHSPMNLFRGYSDDKKLEKWLEDDIWPLEERIDEQDVYYGSLFAFMEMISTGTTCFNDMYFHTKQISEAATEIGIRGYVGYGMIDLNDDTKRKKEIKKAKKSIKEINNLNSDLVNPTITPHSIDTCSEELYIKSKEIADKHDLFLHTHLSEVDDTSKQAIKLDKLDIIDERFIGAHGVHLSNKEIDILSKSDATIVHNPCSNMKLCSGIAPIKAMNENGLNLGIGTDSSTSNNNLDMFEEMKFTSLLEKINNRKPANFKARDIYQMSTLNPSQTFNRKIGKIEKNYLADIVFIDKNSIGMKPTYNIYSNMVYSNVDISKVVINGNLVYENNEFKGIEQKNVLKKIDNISNRLSR